MNWAQQIDFEDQLKGDARLVYEHCGEDVFLALIDAFAGKSMYLRAEVVTAMKKRYIRERRGELTVKELAVRLDVSDQFVYDTLRAKQGGEQDEKENSLFDSVES
jgi:hypothetical protein